MIKRGDGGHFPHGQALDVEGPVWVVLIWKIQFELGAVQSPFKQQAVNVSVVVFLGKSPLVVPFQLKDKSPPFHPPAGLLAALPRKGGHFPLSHKARLYGLKGDGGAFLELGAGGEDHRGTGHGKEELGSIHEGVLD